MNKQQFSWRLIRGINSLNTLFKDQFLPYIVTSYICNCNEVTHIIGNEPHKEEFLCPNCENTQFLEVNDYLKSQIWYQPFETQFSLDDLEYFEYTINRNENDVSFLFLLKIPKHVEMVSNKVEYFHQKLYGITIDSQNNYTSTNYCNIQDESQYQEYHGYEEVNEPKRSLEIVKAIEKKFLKVAISNLSTSNFVFKRCKDLYEIAFFVFNPHLKSYAFYSWKDTEYLPNENTLTIDSALEYISNNRKEKSLKKALYENYKKQLKNETLYRYIYIYNVCKYIKDPNIAIKLIELDFDEHCDYLFDKNHLENLFGFLIQRYTDKQIENLFKVYLKEYPYLMNDTATMIHDIGEEITLLPNTIKANCYTLHDELVLLMQKFEDNGLFQTIYNYPITVIDRCVKIDEFVIKVPKDGEELYNWSNILKNCLISYNGAIASNNRIIYGFFQNNILEFAIELYEEKILQAKQKYNENITQAQQEILNEWYEMFVKKK